MTLLLKYKTVSQYNRIEGLLINLVTTLDGTQIIYYSKRAGQKSRKRDGYNRSMNYRFPSNILPTNTWSSK